MTDVAIGATVTAKYKSGEYYGEVIDLRPEKRQAVVKVTAVKRHPVQGDLHHPNETEVPLFHERKALSKFEKANIPINTVKPFSGEVPGYESSLKEAVDIQKNELREKNTAWAAKALETLETVEQSYSYK